MNIVYSLLSCNSKLLSNDVFMMTCKYNIPLEINSNWFFKTHLGKQCCIIHRLVMGILEGISAKSIINLSVNCSLALLRFGPKD